MRFASEELVRVVVSAILRSAPWTHAFLCYLCLLNLMLEHLGPAYNEYEYAARWIGFSTSLDP